MGPAIAPPAAEGEIPEEILDHLKWLRATNLHAMAKMFEDEFKHLRAALVERERERNYRAKAHEKIETLESQLAALRKQLEELLPTESEKLAIDYAAGWILTDDPQSENGRIAREYVKRLGRDACLTS